MASVFDNLRAAMAAADPPITPKQLAEKLGREYSTIADAIGGRGKTIGVHRLLRYATVLKVPIEQLVVGVDEAYDQMRCDLARQTAPVQPAVQTPEGSERAETRRLEERIAELERQLSAAQDVFEQVGSLIGKPGAREEAGPSQDDKPRDGRRNRTAR